MSEELSSKENEQIVCDLQSILGKDKVLYRRIELEARAGDASIYRLVPRVVVLPSNEDDVVALLDYCRKTRLYVTFRAAGTSLSGQAVTDGILADVATHWKGVRVLENGEKVAVQPGVIGARVNEILLPYRRKIGPDPASINACMVGGIAANNASGMCCNVAQNSYHTMASMKFVLADGFRLDTALPEADDRLAQDRPTIYEGLLALRKEITSSPELSQRIKTKFSIKNTCGYSLNAFVDFERPVDILSHLLIGSEGTLGFISEITYNTVREYPAKATALVYFAHFVDAHRSVKPLADAGAAVLEIMDSAAMRSVEQDMDYGFDVAPEMGALLVEFQEDDEAILRERMAKAHEILGRYSLLKPVEFTTSPEQRERFWKMRKGLFPSVGAMRQQGTAVIIEDVCVRPEQLADCALDLQQLFQKHEFPDSIIFGHAKAGNLHFVICTDFTNDKQKAHYAALMEDVVKLIVNKYDGSLKGEHGTGRNMAPFVELEWGKELYDLMWRVKKLLDPDNILNPGVVLNNDPHVYLKDLKAMPSVSPIVDKCIECGYCESKCPSRYLTFTPRQRIAVLRQLEIFRKTNANRYQSLLQDLEKDYRYYGVETCATDSLCSTACPVGIDTGQLVKELRALSHGRVSKNMAMIAAKHFSIPASAVRLGLGALHLSGKRGKQLVSKLSHHAHKLTKGMLPRLPERIPLPAPAPRIHTRKAPTITERSVLYLPSCLTRTMGKLPGETIPVDLARATMDVLAACGYEPFIPEGVSRYCCGQPFVSKGFPEAAQKAAQLMVDFLWDSTLGGACPIVCDTSPCSGTITHTYGTLLTGDYYRRWKKLRIYDLPVFFAKVVIPSRSEWPKVPGTAILHPTCTLIKSGGSPALKLVAETFCEHVYIPAEAGCCGFAGDRGFLVPELTESATAAEAREILAIEQFPSPLRYYSTSRTCEMGMTAATGKVFQSIVYLCYEALVATPARSA